MTGSENRPPENEEEKAHPSVETEQAAPQHTEVGTAVLKLASEIAAFRNDLQADNKAEQGYRRQYEINELYWTKIGARAAIGFSVISLVLSGLTLLVLNNTFGVYQKQATIMSTQATIMAKQRDIADTQTANFKRQLDDYEAVESASLTIENFSIEDFPQHSKLKFNMVNTGPTVATDIGIDQIGSILTPVRGLAACGVGGAKAHPAPGGLQVGGHRALQMTVPMEEFYPYVSTSTPGLVDDTYTLKNVVNGRFVLSICAVVSYKTAFGKTHVVTDCRMYRNGEFEECLGAHSIN